MAKFANLSQELTKRIKKFKKDLKEVELSDIETTLENFDKDPNREKEIVWWENLAEKYLEETKDQELSLDQKKEIFKKVFLKEYAKTMAKT